MENNKSILEKETVKKLSDDELEQVTGGSNLDLHFFDREEDIIYIFFRNDVVYVKENIFCSKTRCVVDHGEPFYDPQYHCYEDMYIVRDPDGLLRKVLRDDIVNEAF